MKYSRIIGTGSYLPQRLVTNADLEKIVDTSDDWIVERTGIRQRYMIGPDETNASMSTIAARRAVEAADIDPQKIGLIITATSTPDNLLPSNSCLIQDQLGIGDCAAFDIMTACSGFNYALSIADKFIRTGACRNALVMGSECMSRIYDWNDRTTCVLFGDGAGAVVLTASDEPGILSTHLHAAGQYKDVLYTRSGLVKDEPAFAKMQGKEVFKLAVNKLGEVIQETLAANNLESSAIDWLVPHQANIRIIQAMAKKFDIPLERVVMTVDKHANTSAASVPLALDTAVRDGRIKKGQMLLLESFGGGISWGSALLKY